MRRLYSGFTIILILFFAAICDAQTYEAKIIQSVNGNTFNVDIYLHLISGVSSNIGDATFSFNYNQNAINYMGKDNAYDGRWDEDVSISYNDEFSSNAYGIAALNIHKSTIGIGVDIPGTQTLVGRIQFTILNSSLDFGIEWNENFTDIKNWSGSSMGFNFFMDGAILFSPSSLTASSLSASEITLTWSDNSSNEMGFKIERKTGTGNFIELGLTGANTTTYTDRGLASATSYVYRIRATNSTGDSGYSNELTATTDALMYESRIMHSIDDVEEYYGVMNLYSSDIDIAFEGEYLNIGLRYRNVTIPPGAQIQSAYLQFTADEVKTGSTTLHVHSEAHDDSPEFSTSHGNLRSRSFSSNSVTWSPPAWNTVGESNTAQRTPNISSVLQEVIDRIGWQSGNALMLKLSASHYLKRVAESYDAVPGSAALLHVEYSLGTSGSLGGPSNLLAVPITSNRIDLSWMDNASDETGFKIERKSGTNAFSLLTTVSSNSNSYSDHTVDGSTIYTYRVFATDGTTDSDYSNEAEATTDLQTLVRQIAQSSDDAEERYGVMNLSDNKLEITWDSEYQNIGLRFQNINLPGNAIIVNAYIQFTTAEASLGTVLIDLHSEAIDNASTFTTAYANLRDRNWSTASVNWSPNSWTTIGESGILQRTPDISSLVSEIISRSGWQSGNALSFKLSGTSFNHRVAKSFDSGSSVAAVLYIDYLVN
ncbi:fibronectin type III domain-containing protein [bacterium]|nr:fibronectin type III domain-containing protein [bacterium]